MGNFKVLLGLVGARLESRLRVRAALNWEQASSETHEGPSGKAAGEF